MAQHATTNHDDNFNTNSRGAGEGRRRTTYWVGLAVMIGIAVLAVVLLAFANQYWDSDEYGAVGTVNDELQGAQEADAIDTQGAFQESADNPEGAAAERRLYGEDEAR